MLARRFRFGLGLGLAVALPLVGCQGDAPPAIERPVDGALARHATAQAHATGVPRDLLLAIAQVEGGLLLPRHRVVRPEDHVPVGGILELRHGAFNSLARGAALLGTDEQALREDTDLGTVAGARVLAELGRQNGASADDLASWRRAVTILSGLGAGRYRDQYLADVFATLRRGGAFPARDGETVYLEPHPELDGAGLGVLSEELGGPPPDFAGAIWFDTNCNGKCTPGRPDGNGAVDTIVIHDTEGGWAGSVATLQFDAGKSVHYIVDADGGRVGQFIHEVDTGWHAGNWCYNKHSIGIEHVGVAADPNGYSDGLYQKSVALVKDIRSRWNVPLDRSHIIGHYQIPNGNLIPECGPPCSDTLDKCETGATWGGSGNHRDPGYHWEWCQYFQRLGGACTCSDAWPLWNCTTDHTEAVRCVNGTVEIAQCMPCESQKVGVDDICHMITSDMATAEAADLASAGPADAGTPGDAASGRTADGATAMTVNGGCGCRLAGRSDGNLAIATALLLFAALLVRRRYTV